MTFPLAAAPTLEEGFRTPPNEAKPHLWWHWMNGNVSKEGITADLEAMAEVGIGGAQIFDAGCNIPPGGVDFNSPAWFDCFEHAGKEAARLGIELCHANCSGWSSSGGPWITPDKSMKWVIPPGESDVIRGPAKFEGAIPRPAFFTNVYAGKLVGDYYRDIAVLAYPVLKPMAGTTNVMRLTYWKNKNFIDRQNDFRFDTRIAGPGEFIEKGKILDLTSKFDSATGILRWDVPAGEWRVIRVGFASNGQRNFPASEHGVGLEVDKLSEAAVRFHMDQYCAKLVQRLGPAAGNHPYGLNNILIDSYEVKSQNWTDGFEKTFEKAKGYSIIPYLPLVSAGYIVNSVEESERVLEDFRRVIADEFAKNYAGGLQKRCHELGLKLSIEPYGNCPADNLQYGRYCDIPSGEFWSHGQLRNMDEGNARLAAHVAHAWGKRIVAMEAFSADPGTGGRWTTTPFSLKAQGDCTYAAGANRMVYHRFAHQPWTANDYFPGMTMGHWGIHFERSNTWWFKQKEWLKYQARCQWMLMEGAFAADILLYYGEMAPNIRSELYFGLDNPKDMPRGYDYDQCEKDVVLGLKVVNGRMVNAGGVSYAVLVLPPDDFMSLEMIVKLEQLADAGAMIIGSVKPVRCLGMSGNDAKVREIADRIWGTKIKTCSLKTALAEAGIQQDCYCATPCVDTVWTHRHGQDGSDWYFVAARNPDLMDRIDFSFRDTKRVPELWNPEKGTIERARKSWIDWRGRCVVRLENFPPDGSMFIVFRDQAEKLPVEKKYSCVKSIPLAGPWKLSFPKGWKAPESITLPALCDWTDYPDDAVRYFSGTAEYELKIENEKLKIEDGERAVLDLGAVKHFAEVIVNGKSYPILWRPPYTVDITDALKPSSPQALKLSVRVTNLWPNRLIGDDRECADDCEWKKDTWTGKNQGGIVEIPEWVKKGGKSPTGRCTFTTWKHWNKDDDLLPSGLLGPVVLRFEKQK